MEKKYNGAEHMRLKNLILMELSKHGAMVWNNPTGVFYTRTGQPVKVGTPGAADIIGVTANGQALAVEVKTGTGRLSPDQKKWRDIFCAHGGLHIEARGLDDVRDI